MGYDKDLMIEVLEQRIKLNEHKIKVAETALEVVEAWGNKQINKRLGDAIQAKIDDLYGRTPIDSPNWKGETSYSNLSVGYSKDTNFEGNPRYELRFYGRSIVPSVMSGETEHRLNDDRLELQYSYWQDLDKLKERLTHDIEMFKNSQVSCAHTIANLDKIIEANKNVIESIQSYSKFMDQYSGLMRDLLPKIDRSY